MSYPEAQSWAQCKPLPSSFLTCVEESRKQENSERLGWIEPAGPWQEARQDPMYRVDICLGTLPDTSPALSSEKGTGSLKSPWSTQVLGISPEQLELPS